MKMVNRNNVLVAIAVVAIVITASLIFLGSNSKFSFPTLFGMSDSQVAKKAVDYINSSGLSSTPVSLVSVSETEGLVKIKIKIGTSQFDTYITKDGKLLFPQALDMSGAKTAAAKTNTPAASAKTAASVKKASTATLEAFVVSSCPYGLQMQRAIADAVKNAPSLANNVVIRYIGNVNSDGKTVDSMHGPEEGAENLRQICLRQEQPTKFYSYISCYMKKTTSTASSGMPLGDSTGCQASTGVDTGKLAACVADPSRGVAYAKKDFDLATKYNVQGSPTLILNGQPVDESGFGGRSADGVKSMVCAGFNSQPGYCSTKLNTAEASVSFNASYASAGGSAPAANCNTAQ